MTDETKGDGVRASFERWWYSDKTRGAWRPQANDFVIWQAAQSAMRVDKSPKFSKAEWQSILDQMQAASDPDQRTPSERRVMRKIERAALRAAIGKPQP